ncbi:Delta(12)-fatty-acid desaturase, partial [Quaeritorhiza haematococci]
MAAALWWAATCIDGYLPVAARWVAWPVYWVCQGVVLTGLWVIAHECGHQAFSDYAWVNNTVGYILHSALLVPYYSWKISHSKHHKGCGHMTKDQVFVPATRKELGLPPRPPSDKPIPAIELPPELLKDNVKNDDPLHEEKRVLSGANEGDAAANEEEEIHDEHREIYETPLFTLFNIAKMLLVGWPAYLLLNASGQTYPTWTSHFRPTAPIFEPKHFMQVVQSDIGMITVIAGLAVGGQVYGTWAVMKYYVIPYLFVNFWLVLITFLQHTDVKLPHYRGEEWSFLRGALATVDRDYGVLNHFFHHIGDTHVAHHLFSTMPHYH